MNLKKWELDAIKMVAAQQYSNFYPVDFLELVNVGVVSVLKRKERDGRFLTLRFLKTLARRAMIEYKLEAKYHGVIGWGRSGRRTHKKIVAGLLDTHSLLPTDGLVTSHGDTEQEAFLTMAIENARKVVGYEEVQAILEGKTDDEIWKTIPGMTRNRVTWSRKMFREIVFRFGF